MSAKMDRNSLHRKIRELAAVPKGEVHLIVLLEKYVSRHADDVLALLAYGDALRVIGRRSEAEALFKGAFESSQVPKVRAELAMSLAMATESVAPLEAEQWFSRFLELAADAPGWAWVLRGANLARLERFDEAVECYKTALKQKDVDRDEALKNIALAYRAKGDYGEALAHLRRIQLVAEPDSEVALLIAALETLDRTRSWPMDWSDEDGDPIAVAIATFDPLEPEGLRSLLLDDDPIVRRRGLFVFGAVGRKAFVVLDAALKSVDDPRVSARANLMDGVLCFSKQLSPPQAQTVLKLTDDPEDLVREKIVAFLGAAVQETIESAIELFDEPLRSEYRKAFEKFSAEPSQAQILLQEGLASTSVPATFALASIQRMARNGRLTAVPDYHGDSYVGQGVVANTARLMRNATRRGRP